MTYADDIVILTRNKGNLIEAIGKQVRDLEINESKTKYMVLNEQQKGRDANLVSVQRMATITILRELEISIGWSDTGGQSQRRNRDSRKNNKGHEMYGGFGVDTKGQ